MIIVKLMGGLGNQMFQYAAGKRLAKLHKTELKLDKGILGKPVQEGVTPREVELDLLRVNLLWASRQEIDSYRNKGSGKYLRVMQRKFPFLFREMYLAESGHGYYSRFNQLPSKVYLDGFWQSEKYFADIRQILLSEFKPMENLSGLNSEWISNIKSCNSVSVHIRRGDYVTNTQANHFHGVLPMSYYHDAVSFITKDIMNPVFFVFSDDPNWVKDNFRLDYPTYIISHNMARNSVFDLELMSACQHNIIANSSFSWWGAWLNASPQKIVVAPKFWFRDNPSLADDLIPSSWHRL